MSAFVRPRYRTLWHAALLLGIGLGGFVDGILLHQILQWHHMASSVPSRADDLPFNTMLDGFFHAAAWGFTLAGVIVLHQAWRRAPGRFSARVLAGGMLAGWGLFNLVEGVIDHHVLGVHHVWPAGPGPVWAWDIGFLIVGLAFLAAGTALARQTHAAPTDRN